jgi:glycogen synthase
MDDEGNLAAVRTEVEALAASIHARVRDLRVLNAGWEGGDIPVMHRGNQITVRLGRAGGMGVVIPELSGALMQYAGARGLRWQVDNVAPLLSNAVTTDVGGERWGRAELELHGILVNTGIELGPFRYGDRAYTVQVWRIDAKTHAQYLLDQPELWGRVAILHKGKHTEPDIYGVPEGADPFPWGVAFPEVTTVHAMSEYARRRYVIFSQAVAAFYAHGGYGVLLGNDYHVGLAPFYHPDLLQITIGHNLGYQGVDSFYFRDRRHGHRISIGPESVRRQVEDYCEKLGIAATDLYEYFLAFRTSGYVGTPVWLQAILRLNFQRCGLAATTVSQHYADQLHLDRAGIEQKIREARDFTPPDYFDVGAVQGRIRAYWGDNTRRYDLWLPNQNLFDLTQYHAVGVLNGLNPAKHLRRDEALLGQLGLDDLVERPPEARIQNPAELQRVKAAARRALFADKRLSKREIKDHGQALHVAWGRLVAQKGFHILMEEIEHITQRRSEVLIVIAAAPANDVEGVYLEKRFTEMDEQFPNFVFINAFDAGLVRLARVAADVAHMTSRDEPCGLTDVEAFWSGTLCAVHKVGGLTKGIWDEPGYGQVRELDPRGEPVAFGYDAFDTSDPIGEARAFRRAYEALIDLKYHNPDHFAALQFKALGMMQFTYAIPANRYIDLIQYVLGFQVWRKLRADINAGRIPVQHGLDLMREYLSGDEGDGAHLDNDPTRPTRYALFRDVFRPPRLFYVDELDRSLHDAL